GSGPLNAPKADRRIAAGPDARRAPRRRPSSLLAKTELRDEIGVTLFVFLTQVIEKRTALVDQHQEAAARMVVLRVALEVLGEVLDALGEDCDLHLGRTR